jgi:hypothetical protein
MLCWLWVQWWLRRGGLADRLETVLRWKHPDIANSTATIHRKRFQHDCILVIAVVVSVAATEEVEPLVVGVCRSFVWQNPSHPIIVIQKIEASTERATDNCF